MIQQKGENFMKKSKKKNKYSLWDNIHFFYKKLYQYEPKLIWMMVAAIFGGIIMPVFSIYIPKAMVDLVTEQASVTKYVVLLGGIVFIYTMFSVFYEYMNNRGYMERNLYRNYLLYSVFWKSLHIPYKKAESGKVRENYWESVYSLRSGDWSCSSLFYSELPALIIAIGNFFIYSGVIGVLSPWIMVGLIVLSFFNFLLLEGERRYRNKLWPEMDKLNGKLQYINNAAGGDGGSASTAKDIRIFHMQDWILNKADDLQTGLRALDNKITKRVWIRENIGHVVGFFRDLVAYAYLILETASGHITAGEFVLYLGAIMGFGNFVNGIIGNIQSLLGASDRAQRYREYNDLMEEDVEVGTVSVKDLRMPLEIEFSHVDFAYEKENILTNLNFKIHAGEKIAIVGVNGAGKTTIIKLLCGFYEPTKGTIRINGVDIKEFAKKDLYQLFSAVFQDNRIFPFKVAENLTLQKQEKVELKRAQSALEQAGLWEAFEKNNISLDDYMTNYFLKDGVVLSGGETQKFMLARAIYKDAPILVLDEPTAALDPIAESEVYQEYAKISQDKTSIFISHRLASTKFSDRIFFLRDGKITESGSHEDLMKQKGDYAHMFEVQSSYYKKGEEHYEYGFDH